MAKDPVCGMEIQEGSLKSNYKGNPYYFCSPGCQKAFNDNPKKFVK